ncbi:hypothetical protein RRG08_065132 [Elysia crispata]|uniref:Uncharacterized protein n=1 Tax=Elysia crispata TaxID=231223 RepID=A0AAE1DCF1_9GAST|nr:hypothetical protein RRG08_065132 [Elysia crispata]
MVLSGGARSSCLADSDLHVISSPACRSAAIGLVSGLTIIVRFGWCCGDRPADSQRELTASHTPRSDGNSWGSSHNRPEKR